MKRTFIHDIIDADIASGKFSGREAWQGHPAPSVKFNASQTNNALPDGRTLAFEAERGGSIPSRGTTDS